MSDPQSGNTHYFDVNSLVSTTNESGNRLNFFDSKIVFSRPVQSDVHFAIIQVEISCTNRTIRSLRFEQYDAQERLIGVEQLAYEWYNIPSTNTTAANIMNGFYTLACSEPS
ncbi:MAG TPA: hypothetical protein DDZ80_03160 [Cyanobacteria bacterium UBA8803]|nr:hypothetical protein [Cyanobacteria bacterium UBA9273]HBL57576.1 hypothetical protein [Cyanobacteria bacterium UBA8803]